MRVAELTELIETGEEEPSAGFGESTVPLMHRNM